MDALSGFLDAPRARGAFVLRTVVSGEWAIRIEDRAPLTLVGVARGEAWLRLDDLEPMLLRAGEVVLVGEHHDYELGDQPGREPQARIGPGQVCTRPDGSPLSDFRDLGVASWGNVADDVDPGQAQTVLVTGTYEYAAQVGRRLLDHLPPVVQVRGDDSVSALVALLTAELDGSAPGQGSLVDRLVDLLTAAVVRAWFTGGGAAPTWWTGAEDPVVGAALRRIHHEPERAWTVATLAAQAQVSRAVLARRFTEVMGEAPIAYLTRWRLDVAADLLVGEDLTIAAVAHRVGYGTPFSFSAAFRRRHEMSPSSYRAAARGGPSTVDRKTS